MSGYVMGAIGALVLFVLGLGCATQPQVSSVSAMVRTDDARAQVSGRAITVDLGQIVTP